MWDLLGDLAEFALEGVDDAASVVGNLGADALDVAWEGAQYADAAGGTDWWGVAKQAIPVAQKALKATMNAPYGANGGGPYSAQNFRPQQLPGNFVPMNGGGGRTAGIGQAKTTSYEDWKASWDRRMAALISAQDTGVGSSIQSKRLYGRRRSR